MIKHSTARTLFLSGVVVLAIIITAFFAISIPTHAAPAGGYAQSTNQSNIQQVTGKQAHFSPNTLSCTRSSGK